MSLERVAFHEASHAVAAYLLGGKITGPVSIRPSRRWKGVAFCRGPGYRLHEDRGAFTVPALPARVRRHFEIEALISLAGVAGEALAPANLGGYTPEPRSLEEVVSKLPARDVRLLAEALGEEELDTDFQAAFRNCRALTGNDGRTYALLAWLETEAQALVRAPTFRLLADRLARALLEQEAVSARRVRLLLKGRSDEQEAA